MFIFGHKKYLYLVGLSLLITGFFVTFSVLASISDAGGVADHVKVIINLDKSDSENNLEVVGITRGGAEFVLNQNGIARDDQKIFTSSDWLAGIKVRGSVKFFQHMESVDIFIGEQRHYNFNNEETVAKWDIAVDGSRLIGANVLSDSLSKIPYFKNIINWPGDMGVVLRALVLDFHRCLLFFLGMFIGFSLYLYWVDKKNSVSVTNEEQVNYNNFLKTLFATLLSAVSIFIFIKTSPTAFEWPAIDMGPFFSRLQDPSFCLNDFFTNSSSLQNPRFIFGYLVVGLGYVLHVDWYAVLFLLKTLMVVFLPPIIFLSLGSVFADLKDEKRKAFSQFIIFLGVLFALNLKISGFFSVALWMPYQVIASAQGFAVFISFLAVYVENCRSLRKTSLVLWFFASLMHPSVGLSFLIFYLLINVYKKSIREIGEYAIVGVLLPFAILGLLFPARVGLSSKDFVYHYISANHAVHYLPTQFGTFNSSLPWYLVFILISLLLVFAGVIGVFRKDKFLKTISFLSLFTYTGSVLVQYIFVELYPVKVLAILGPVRYTMVGYWLAVIVYSHLLSGGYRYVPFLIGKLKFSVKKVGWIIFFVLSFFIFFLFFYYQDHPVDKVKDQDKNLYEWIENNTKRDDVFVSNVFDLTVNLPLVAQRAVFTGNGFPFREDDFFEYNTRKFLVFGSPDNWIKMGGSLNGVKTKIFYRSLTPQDFIRISHMYKLDYVIVENDFSDKFNFYTSVYQNNDVKIFKIVDLKREINSIKLSK